MSHPDDVQQGNAAESDPLVPVADPEAEAKADEDDDQAPLGVADDDAGDEVAGAPWDGGNNYQNK